MSIVKEETAAKNVEGKVKNVHNKKRAACKLDSLVYKD